MGKYASRAAATQHVSVQIVTLPLSLSGFKVTPDVLVMVQIRFIAP